MFSLFNELRNREITGSNRGIRALLKERFDKNILSDNYIPKKLEFENNISNLAHNDDYLALINGHDKLELFSISSTTQLWSSPFRHLLSENTSKVEKLMVSPSGLVLLVTTPKSFRANFIYQILVFLGGKHVGNFMINMPFYLDSFKIIDNRIFGISIEHRKFYEWDMSGKIVQSIFMENLINSIGLKIASDEKQIFVTATQKGRAKNPPIFIFDLDDNISHELELNQSEFDADELKIDSLLLTDNYLVIGSHQQKLTPRYDFTIECDPTITIIERATWKVVGQYHPDLYEGEADGSVKHLFGNNYFIVFLNYLGCRSGDYLYCIDLSNHMISKIKRVPECIDSGNLSIHLDGSILNICYPGGFWNSYSAYAERCRIDLKNHQEETQEVKGVRYRRFPWCSAFFSSNTLIVPNRFSQKNYLYFERFNHLADSGDDIDKSDYKVRLS